MGIVLGGLHILRDDQYYSDKGFVLTFIQVFNKGTDIIKELFEFVHTLGLNYSFLLVSTSNVKA